MSLFEGLLEFLFPTRCLVCRREGPDVLCRECRASIQPVGEPLCCICGIPAAGAPGEVCPECTADPPFFSSARGVAVYGGSLRKAVHVLKYGGKRRMARPLAALLADAFWKGDLSSDFIVPVPLHPARERRRGFNQAHLLSVHLSEMVSLPVESSALRKIQPTAPQRTLTREERKNNLRGAFVVAEVRKIEGKSVLLVDDVMTTGATLSEVSRVLRTAGAIEVHCLCVARDLRRRRPA